MLMPIDLPPGVFRNGTERQAAGRYWDANLVRWFGRLLGPIGGWRRRSNNAVTGAARALMPWRASSTERWIGIGTHSGLFVQNSAGQVFDITPSDFVAGDETESNNTGFGAGAFGGGTYGTQRRDTGNTKPALVWDLDVWASYLVGCAFSDGRLHMWTLDTLSDAAPIPGAPTNCVGVVVSEQGFLFALGADDNPRKVKWSSQGDETDWTPTALNQAGDIDLVTSGTITKGVKLGPLVLVLTDLDAHVGRYVGLPYVYSFERAGYGCGAISKGCLVQLGQQAAWWSRSGFWLYDGSVRPIECEVYDYVVRNLNQGQRSKITGFHNSEFGEAWWFYPSGDGAENDSYVCWDYRRDHWNIGSLARLSAAEASVFRWPLAMDADGYCHEHEVETNYDGATPFAETGPVELGAGDQVMRCLRIVPDEDTAGQVTVSFRTRPYPNGAETVLGETSLTAAGVADLRFTARQTKLRITGAEPGSWRFGSPKLDLKPGGRR